MQHLTANRWAGRTVCLPVVDTCIHYQAVDRRIRSRASAILDEREYEMIFSNRPEVDKLALAADGYPGQRRLLPALDFDRSGAYGRFAPAPYTSGYVDNTNRMREQERYHQRQDQMRPQRPAQAQVSSSKSYQPSVDFGYSRSRGDIHESNDRSDNREPDGKISSSTETNRSHPYYTRSKAKNAGSDGQKSHSNSTWKWDYER